MGRGMKANQVQEEYRASVSLSQLAMQINDLPAKRQLGPVPVVGPRLSAPADVSLSSGVFRACTLYSTSTIHQWYLAVWWCAMLAILIVIISEHEHRVKWQAKHQSTTRWQASKIQINTKIDTQTWTKHTFTHVASVQLIGMQDCETREAVKVASNEARQLVSKGLG